MHLTTERLGRIAGSRGWAVAIVVAAYLSVFAAPLWALATFVDTGAPPGLGQRLALLVLHTATTLLFVADFGLHLRLRGRAYLRESSSWINVLIVADFLVAIFGRLSPVDPVVLRLLRTSGVVGRLGLLQRAGRIESGLASVELARSHEDDVRYSIVLLLAFSMLSWKFAWREYAQVWDPLVEIAVYAVVIAAVRLKIRRGVERLRENVINPLQRLTQENRARLSALLGEQRMLHMGAGALDRHVRDGKNEIDLIVEQVDEIFRQLKKFVSERTLREARGEVVIPAGHPIALVFSDIEDFSGATQEMQGAVIAPLAMYLRTMSEPIIRHGGDIEKYIGDAIFAYWHDPADPARAVARSFDAVLDCVTDVRQLCETAGWQALFEKGSWQARSRFRTRFGLHYGPVTAGPIGSVDEQSRVESTLVGDHVNITARLESLAKHYGVYNLMSADFHARLPAAQQARCRRVDYITVKGRETSPFWIHTIDVDARPAGFAEAYEAGLTAYLEGQWSAAIGPLRAAQALAPDDGPTAAMLGRIEASKRYSLHAIDNLGRKAGAQSGGFEAIRRQLEAAIEAEPYVPPLGFVERGGYWRWDVK